MQIGYSRAQLTIKSGKGDFEWGGPINQEKYILLLLDTEN